MLERLGGKMKAVFAYSEASKYDDLPEERYHFPKQYLKNVMAAEGDWIVYYRPRRNGSRDALHYFAVARVVSVVPDQRVPDHFYAYLRDYLELTNPVPHKVGDRFVGVGAPNQFQSAVRSLDDSEFDFILRLGMAPVLHQRPNQHDLVPPADDPFDETRPIVQQMVNRKVRDAAFAKQVVGIAYQGRCAITGLCITNGLGRAEVEAAHIKPVERDGPDSPRNGLALSRTVHWMFDRGLISIGDNHDILIAKGKIPDAALRLINLDRKLLPPTNSRYLPHSQFLRFHRETIFKG
jgi:putative restriction endonuclease